jgi:hypothetical protein
MPDCEGNVERLCISEGESHDGSVLRLSCCPQPAAQEQELVRRWKQTRKGLFSTMPTPYGSALFSTGNYEYGIKGPPVPGDTSIRTVGGVILPPTGANDVGNPDTTPINNESQD